MRANVKRHGDLGDIFANPDIDAMLNDELSDLHELLTDAFEDYSVTSTQKTVTANTDSVALPTDLYKLRGVEDDANDDEPLPRFNWEDRKNVGELSYCVLGSNLIVRPKQSSNRVYNVWYVSVYTELTADGDTFTCPQRWHRLAELNAAARLLDSIERDTTELQAKADKVRQQIIASAAQRDAGDPGKARDVRSRYGRPLNGFDFDRERF